MFRSIRWKIIRGTTRRPVVQNIFRLMTTLANFHIHPQWKFVWDDPIFHQKLSRQSGWRLLLLKKKKFQSRRRSEWKYQKFCQGIHLMLTSVCTISHQNLKNSYLWTSRKKLFQNETKTHIERPTQSLVWQWWSIQLLMEYEGQNTGWYSSVIVSTTVLKISLTPGRTLMNFGTLVTSMI
jgi:hypothetical protein